MRRTTRNLGFVAALMIFTVLSFGNALAGTIEGTVQGLSCVIGGKLCPIDHQDPHLAAEKSFVVLSADRSYHFVSNLDRAILARYLSKKVRVSGKISSEYNAIMAKKFEVYMDGKWQTKWTIEMEKEARKRESVG